MLLPADCDTLARRLDAAEAGRAGARHLLSQPWCRAVARQVAEHAALAALLPPGGVAVQCTYFEKSAARNWLVTWHQDLSIPVAERVADAGLRGWSRKEEVWHVQAPVDVLETLVAVRLHLDPCTADDGPLRVAPGSHRHGLMDDSAAGLARLHAAEVVCTAGRGSALVMRPLLCHASSKARGTSLRRVLHFVYGPPVLPCGLRWPSFG